MPTGETRRVIARSHCGTFDPAGATDFSYSKQLTQPRILNVRLYDGAMTGGGA